VPAHINRRYRQSPGYTEPHKKSPTVPGALGAGATGERKGPGQRYGMCKNVRERQPGPYALTKRIIAANPKGRACCDGKTVMSPAPS
jgi:hypothetical protein